MKQQALILNQAINFSGTLCRGISGTLCAEYPVRWEKNKKHSVGQRVGLDAVQLQYGLYVFGHLSKWFVFVLMFKF